MILIKTLLLIFALIPAVAAQEARDEPGEGKRSTWVKKIQTGVHGSLGQRVDGGVGIVVVDGCLFIEAIVINGGVVESGVFYLDTRTSTACVMERLFAKKMNVVGLGSVTLKFGDVEIKNAKATVLDHPNMQTLFKKHTALFKNKPISGVIGYPALAAKRTVIDLKEFKIRFFPLEEPDKTEESDKSDKSDKAEESDKPVIPFRDDMKTPWLELRLNNKVDCVFHLATGSAVSWIRKDVAIKAGIRRGKNPRSLKAGEIELCPLWLNLVVLKEPPKYDGLPFPVAGCLGIDFLSHFKTTIDAVNKRLILDPP